MTSQQTENKQDNISPETNKENTQTKQTVVNVDTKTFSVGLFLLCFFLPFFSPLIALIRGKWILLLIMAISAIICFFLLAIPVLGWIIVVIVDLIFAIQVAKGKNKVEVKVNT